MIRGKMHFVLTILCTVLAGASGYTGPVMSGCSKNYTSLTLLHGSTRKVLVNSVNCGSLQNKTDFQTEPFVIISLLKRGHNYTLVQLRINQTNPHQGVYLNWLVANIVPDVSRLPTSAPFATVLAKYEGFSPGMRPSGSLLKYVTLLYPQNTTVFRPFQPIEGWERKSFSLAQWMGRAPFNAFNSTPWAGTEYLINDYLAGPGLHGHQVPGHQVPSHQLPSPQLPSPTTKRPKWSFTASVSSVVVPDGCKAWHSITLLHNTSRNVLVSSESCGLLENKTNFQTEPIVIVGQLQKGYNYTLVQLRTSQTDKSQGVYLNWLVANIVPDGSRLPTSGPSATVLAKYDDSFPGGLYKYVTLLYAQNTTIYKPYKRIDGWDRRRFSLAQWMGKAPRNTFNSTPWAGTEYLIDEPKLRTKSSAGSSLPSFFVLFSSLGLLSFVKTFRL